jgi:hypothetical protein
MKDNIYIKLVRATSGETFDQFYLDEFIEKMLIYNKVIVSSQRLNEVVFFIQNFGLDQTIELLKSGCIEFHNDIMQVASFNDAGNEKAKRCRMNIASVYQEKHLPGCLTKIQKETGLNRRKFRVLERELLPLVKVYPDEVHGEHFTQFHNDIVNNLNTVKASISGRIKLKSGIDVPVQDIRFEIVEKSSGIYTYDTNVDKLLSITEEERHSIIVSSLLAFDSFNQRFLEMKFFDAINGFNEFNKEILEGKVKFLYESINVNEPIDNLRRVIEFSGLPSFEEIEPGKFDLTELLKLKGSKEIKGFRSWLEDTAGASDDEINEMISSFKAKAGEFYNSKAGKILRFFITTGSDFIIPFSGAGLGLIDNFLLERVLPDNQALAFLNNKVPLIYKD